MKKRLTVLAVLVAAVLVVSGFAVPAMAAESAETVTQTDAVTIVREDESLRGEYEKHFLMSDGTYQATVYNEPVHKLDNGAWVETDNVMTADADTGTDSDRMNILDNYVMEGYGVQNRNLDRLYIGTKSGSLCRGFIQYKTMPTIPEGSTITSATMTLDILDGTAIARNASVYMVEEPWVSGELQWSNQPDATVLVAENISHNEQTKYVFSCVDAVRHWYDGDPTGMNENYGIMVKYHDETLINYNSFYSADCAYESKRPVIAITYETSTISVDVNEGSTQQLVAPNARGTITWETEDSTVATVDTDGVVTGVMAGKTTVTASIGGTVQQKYTVYVTVLDGVYYIRSTNVGLYLGTYGSIAENTAVKLFSQASSGLDQIRQLWKITYLGTGYYSIRPMHKLNMGLHVTSSKADIVDIGTVDTLDGVKLANRMGIERTAEGYFLHYVNTGSISLRPETGAISPGMNVVTGISAGDSTYAWQLELVTGMFLNDSNYEPTDIADAIEVEVEMGDTYTQAQMGFVLTTSNLEVEWTTNNSAISVNSAGALTAGERGNAVITASATSENTQYLFELNVTSIETIYVKNYYDSTIGDSAEKISNISNAVSFLNTVYFDDFQLRFVMDGTPTQYSNAGVDICPLGTEECTDACSASCLTHHKNLFRLALELYNNQFETNHIVALWSDSPANTFCDSVSEVHSTTKALAGTPIINGVPMPVIQVFTIEDSVDYGETFMAINLAHEVAHTLGLKEIYLNEYGDDANVASGGTQHSSIQNTNFGCIMKYYNGYSPMSLYHTALDGQNPALCEYCQEKLHAEILDDVYES